MRHWAVCLNHHRRLVSLASIPHRIASHRVSAQRPAALLSLARPDANPVESGRPCRLSGPLPLMQRARFSAPTSQTHIHSQSQLLPTPPNLRRRRLLRSRLKQRPPAGRSRTASSALACAACTLRVPAPHDPRPPASGTRRTALRARRPLPLASSSTSPSTTTTTTTATRHRPSLPRESPTSPSSGLAPSATSIHS